MWRLASMLFAVALAATGCDFPTLDLSGPSALPSSPVADTLLLGDWTGQLTDGSATAAMRFTFRRTSVTWLGDIRAEGWWWSSTDGTSGRLDGSFDVQALSIELGDVGCYGTVTVEVGGSRMQGTYTGGSTCQPPMKNGRLDLTRTCTGAAC